MAIWSWYVFLIPTLSYNLHVNEYSFSWLWKDDIMVGRTALFSKTKVDTLHALQLSRISKAIVESNPLEDWHTGMYNSVMSIHRTPAICSNHS